MGGKAVRRKTGSGLAFRTGGLPYFIFRMINRLSIRGFCATALLLGAAGCTTPVPLAQSPLTQDGVDQFLAAGRDPRVFGITTYQDPGGPRFEFANRPHPDQSARRDFISPKNTKFPVIEAQSAITDIFPMLVDTSARQTWGAMSSAKGLEYRVFAPPTGEYADHVIAEIPGYAGVGNKLILDELHIESPIYYLAPARGMLGALSRIAGTPGLAPAAQQAREKFARRIPVVMGAAMLRNFACVRFDFPARAVMFSTTRAYKPANASAVVANLPMLDWRGRPAVQAVLGGQPVTLVLDTAGEFDLSLPADAPATDGPLALGDLEFDDVRVNFHGELDLPEKFPARLGLGLLSRYAVTLDFKNRRVWFEDPSRPAAETAPADTDENPQPVQYRGVSP